MWVRKRYLAVAALMGASPVIAQGASEPPSASTAVDPAPHAPKISKRLAKILARGDGRSANTAYKVTSVGQEYEILRVLGFVSHRQALVMQDKTYDVLSAENPETGEKREFWFDISAFFGRMF